MKRCLSLLLALILTALCGCGAEPAVTTETAEPAMATIPTTPDGNLVAPTRPEDVELNYTDAALAVKITINPELELALDYAYMVVSATALNADAETLLEGMELEGKPYADAVSAILEKAKEQNFLQSRKKVTVTAREIEEDGWTEAAETVLTKPLVDYQKQSNGVLSYEFYPAGKVADPDNASHTQIDYMGDEVHVLYFLGSTKVKTEITCPDGRFIVVHHISNDESIVIEYLTDGSYLYYRNTPSDHIYYAVYPDGSRDTTVSKKDESGRTIWTYTQMANGDAWEWFGYYEGDRLVRTSSIQADGLQTEEIYHPNGKVAMNVHQSGDEKTEQYFDEQGVIQRHRTVHPDGSVSEGTYENGLIKGSTWTEPDGDYWTEAYRENGTRISSVSIQDGYYYEDFYDESGVPTSSFTREPDGTEYRTVYENGQPKHTTMTRPDGTTETYDE